MVHNHGIDPSCREARIDGQLVGECIAGEHFEATRTTDRKQEPHRWAWEYGVEVLDPDGWRIDGQDYSVPVTREEFLERLWPSTIRLKPGSPLLNTTHQNGDQ